MRLELFHVEEHTFRQAADIINVVVSFRRFANTRNIRHLQDLLKSSSIS
jgi:hypothetical protein